MAWQSLDIFANGDVYLEYDYSEELNIQKNTATLTINLRLRNQGVYGWGNIPAFSKESYIEINDKQYYFSTPALSGAWATGINSVIDLGEITTDPIPLEINELTGVTINSYLYLGDTVQIFTTNEYTYITHTGALESSTWCYVGWAYESSDMSVSGTHILGETDNITITPKTDGVKHTLKYECGEESGTILDNSSDDTIEFRPKVSLSAQNPSKTYVKITFTLITHFPNGQTWEDTYSEYYDIPNIPYCNISVTDATENSEKYGGFVQSKSCFKIVVTPSEENDSPLVRYRINANGEVFDTAEVTTSSIKNGGDVEVTVTITDQRGCVNTQSVTIPVIVYSAPAVTYLAVCRSDENGNEKQTGEYVRVKYTAKISELNGKNSAKYSISYGKTSDASLETEELTNVAGQFEASGTFIFPADKLSSYMVIITAEDDFIDVSRPTQASTAITLINWKKSGLGIAFGTTSEYDNVFENAFKFYPSGGYKYSVIEENNTLNDYTTANTLIIKDLSKVFDAPINYGRGVLDVYSFNESESDDLIQRLTTAEWGEKPRVFIRQRSNYAWSAWTCIYNGVGVVLYDNVCWLMTDNQEFDFWDPVSNQASGILLIFSAFDVETGEANDEHIKEFFISKYAVANFDGGEFTFTFSTSDMELYGNKSLYISDTSIRGHKNNNLAGTSKSGITFDNSAWVLRAIIGV